MEKCPSHKRGARRLTLPKNDTYETLQKHSDTQNVEFFFFFFNASVLDDTIQSAHYPLHSVNYSSVTLLSQCRR